jgi:hypothetical protein
MGRYAIEPDNATKSAKAKGSVQEHQGDSPGHHGYAPPPRHQLSEERDRHKEIVSFRRFMGGEVFAFYDLFIDC